MRTALGLLSALAALLWMGRNLRRSRMSDGWLTEHEEQHRRKALEWTGVGYQGGSKRDH